MSRNRTTRNHRASEGSDRRTASSLASRILWIRRDGTLGRGIDWRANSLALGSRFFETALAETVSRQFCSRSGIPTRLVLNFWLIFIIGLLIAILLFAVYWVIQNRIGDSGIVDVFWGASVAVILVFAHSRSAATTDSNPKCCKQNDHPAWLRNHDDSRRHEHSRDNNWH